MATEDRLRTPPRWRSDANADLTDNSTGTAASEVVDAGATYTQANLNNNFATVANELAELKAALRKAGLLNS